MRTTEEIKKEIAALRRLKPVGQWQAKTAASIALAIEELETGVDQTADEWDELTDSQRDIVNTAKSWKDGDSDDRPAEGWGKLVG